VFRHVGFFAFDQTLGIDHMRTCEVDKTESTMNEKLAEVATTFQLLQTGRAPSNVSVLSYRPWSLRTRLPTALSPSEELIEDKDHSNFHPCKSLIMG
jgi:hypothetical protein